MAVMAQMACSFNPHGPGLMTVGVVCQRSKNHYKSRAPSTHTLQKFDHEWELSRATLASPARLSQVATREAVSPTLTEEVGDENDEGALDGNERGFEPCKD